MTERLKARARILFGLGVIGIGALHFVFPGFMPLLVPVPRDVAVHYSWAVYLTGIVLTFAGILIVLCKWVEITTDLLGGIFLLFFLFGHLPNRIQNSPMVPGAWTDALKLLALAGGAMVVSMSFQGDGNKFTRAMRRITPAGRYLFAFMLLVFGIDHFLYVDFVRTLVPGWIPFDLFWTYLAGVALIGAGVSLFINFKVQTVSFLLGVMLFFWLIMLHIPRALTITGDYGNEIISVMECMAFSGVAFLIYCREVDRRAASIHGEED